MTEPTFMGAAELAGEIREKRLSALDLANHYIERIERLDTTVNAVVVRRFEEARAEAAAADRALARGEALGPLHGVPVTIKESYNLIGTPTTWGFPDYAGNVADSDADTVQALRAAGAVFLGKTNVPQALADFQSYNDVYGTTGNPWDMTRTPGGSSGGSSAALAAGFSALEAGSDIGGSIRNPAHFCGVYGHKPTWGIVSDAGHALPGSAAPADIAVCGPLARTPEDLALALELVAGPDRRHARAWEFSLPRPRVTRLSDLRVALWPEASFAPVSHEVTERVHWVGEALTRAGATVSTTARPEIDVEKALESYYALLWGVMSAGVPDPVHETRRQAAAALDPDDRSPHARAIRGAVQDHRAWVKHHHRRFRLRDAWARFFAEWDILVCPIMPTAAFPHDHAPQMTRTLPIDGQGYPYFEQLHWAGLITVAHLPSTVFPTGLSAAGLPLGLQAVGAEFDDLSTIHFCSLLAQEIGGFIAPPAFG